MKNKLNEKGITLTRQTGIFLSEQGVSSWREENKGITLIALVITVIVLLILAGAAVSIGLNGDDLFAKANEAKMGWNEKVADEDQKLNDAWNILNSIDSNGNITGIGTPSAVNYGEKTSRTVSLGDHIFISTEEFMVIKNDGTTITALPIYNITLSETSPIQSPNAETITFSTESYWIYNNGEDIDMSDSRNNIQKYITAYRNTLINLGATNVTTRVARYGELNEAFSNENYNLDNDSEEFWTGSSSNYGVHLAFASGNFRPQYDTNWEIPHCVRPLIDIEI